MSNRAWLDRIIGDRMAVDREFSDRVTDSEFTRQEWGLIMTAVEFQIDNPGDADRAELVADTSKLPQIMPELENVRKQMGAIGGGTESSSSGGGILGSVRDALGFGGGDGGGGNHQQKQVEAEELVAAYATALQQRLEDENRWDEIRRLAADDS
ncbi:DUF5799 family protein [Halobacteriaceae archaeon GCM10025711]